MQPITAKPLLGVLAAFLIGCGGDRKSAHEGEASEGVPEEFGEWDTERFASDAGEALATLKGFLKGEATELEEGEVVCRGLAGFPMEDMKTGNSFAVRRGKIADGEEIGILKALTQLRSRLPSGKADLVEMKIVGVELTDQQASTTLLVHLADGRLQINAEWEAEWAMGERPKMRSLNARAYEECELLTKGRLVDSTRSVIGDGMPGTEQIVRGMDHWVSRIETIFELEVSGWHGIAVADVNGDGLDDVYLPEPGGLPNRLLVQRTDGTIEDRSRESGLAFLDHTLGALFADFDNDGDQDAALSMIDGVLLLTNDGSGSFRASGSKLYPAAVPYTLAVADYDEDGLLDLFACCYVVRTGATRHAVLARPVPYHDAENGGRNELLRNEGGMRFRNVTKAAGIETGNSKFSYSASWDDFDGDGDLDLYVANDFGRNHLYRNQLRGTGKATFDEIAESSGTSDVAAGMSACWGDYNNDGLVDLYVGNMFSSAGNRISRQEQFRSGRATGTLSLYRRHARGNSLFKNGGNGRFEDVSVSSGTTMGRWAWTSLFADIDNDGWEDVLVANGFITQEDTTDL